MPQPGIQWYEEDQCLLVNAPTYPSKEIKDILGGRALYDGRGPGKTFLGWRVQPIAMNVLKLGEWYGAEFIAGAPKVVQDLFYLDWGFPGFEEHPDLKKRCEEHLNWDDLYRFQQVAVEYAVCNPHAGAVMGLSPGLGKTVVATIVMDVLRAKKVLVLAPLTLAKNWGREIEKWSEFERDWSRATAENKLPNADVTVTNFETVFYTILRDEHGKVFDPGGEETEEEYLHGDSLLDHLERQGNTSERTLKMLKKCVEESNRWSTNSTLVSEWIKSGPKKEDPKTRKKVPARERIVQARPVYAEITWDLIIIDESILLKNRKAVKVEVIQQLTKYSHYVILLSGSATAKYIDDLYPQMKTLKPKAFSSFWRFAEFFCVVEKGHWGWTIEGNKPDVDPQKYLKDFYIVMNQKDVLPELPDYIYEPVEIDLNPDQLKAFTQMVDEWMIALAAEDGVPVVEGDEDLIATSRLAQRTRLLQITSNLCNLTKGAGKPMPSSSAKEDLLVDFIARGDIDFPLLVWSWFVPTTLSIDARLDKHFAKQGLRTTYVNGSLTADQKDMGIEGYKSGDYDVLILQMSVGKFGHTLTNSKTVYYHDRTDDSDAYIQSLRRVRRIGLKHVPRLIVPRAQISADPLVEANLAGKMHSVSKVASHDLMELLRSLGSSEWSMDAYNTGMEDAL